MKRILASLLLLAGIVRAQNIQPRQIHLTTGHIIVGSSSQGADVAVSGDISITSGGVVTVLKVNGSTPGGTCTNQAVTAISSSGVPTCTTLTSAYVNNTIALTGTDINTSNQVTVTHLASPLPQAQGGLATAKIAFTPPTTAGTIAFTADNSTASLPNGTVPKTVASGTIALSTSAITSGTCTSAQTSSATGTLTTDVVEASFNGDPTGVTGYTPATTGMLTIIPYPTADTFNAKVCNTTSSSITPGAITLNWRVTR